uniref:C-type lectin domain-containing protein n=1 Tax=Oryzias latipes TaxID=8090 RepID=A0A3P9I6Z5_ORYLA
QIAVVFPSQSFLLQSRKASRWRRSCCSSWFSQVSHKMVRLMPWCLWQLSSPSPLCSAPDSTGCDHSSNQSSDLWIGVYRDSNISWSDGSNLSFYPTTENFYIQPGVVSARCGYHKWQTRNAWYFYPCGNRLPFICHGHKGEFSITLF